jgi:apolipoprotein N-acyltransferase
MEARREVAVATTNSVSGFIDRDGRVVQRTTEFTADSMVVQMPRRSALTPAIRVAPWLDRGLAAIGLGCCVTGFVLRRRSGSAGPAEWAAPAVPALAEQGGVR